MALYNRKASERPKNVGYNFSPCGTYLVSRASTKHIDLATRLGDTKSTRAATLARPARIAARADLESPRPARIAARVDLVSPRPARVAARVDLVSPRPTMMKLTVLMELRNQEWGYT
ncbi:unnamed protein product [Prunus armeniaca]